MEFDAVIEVPMGSRNKYEMDHHRDRIRLDRTLFTATQYPADYGFVPESLAEDDDPLDVLVLVSQPTFPGCAIPVRPVAVFWMRDEHGPDAKILSVPSHDPRHNVIRDLKDVPAHHLNEIKHFFDVYKDLEPGKSAETRGWGGRSDAERVVQDSWQRFSMANATKTE